MRWVAPSYWPRHFSFPAVRSTSRTSVVAWAPAIDAASIAKSARMYDLRSTPSRNAYASRRICMPLIVANLTAPFGTDEPIDLT
jgi:hypothetical protein